MPTTLQPIIEDHAMDRLVIDCVDMTRYKEYNDGLGWMLTCVDVFTLFGWVFPMPRKEAGFVYKGVLQILLQFGPPKILHSDNGGEFVNSLIDLLCDRFHIKIVHGGPYRPQTQGRVERFNQTPDGSI